MEAIQGGCLCGAVRFKVTPKTNADNVDVEVCHCRMCQSHIGGPLFGVDCEPRLEIEDDSSLGAYASSDWAERCFCKVCGTSLFWRMKDGSHLNVNAGAFDALPNPTLAKEIFIDEKPAYYDFKQDTKKLTGEEVIALFAAGGEA